MRQGNKRIALYAACLTAAGAALLILRKCTGTRFLAPMLWGADFCLSFGLGLWVTLLVRRIRKTGRAAVIVPLCSVIAAALAFAAALWSGGEYGGLVGAFVLAFAAFPLVVSALLQYILLRLIGRKSPPDQ